MPCGTTDGEDVCLGRVEFQAMLLHPLADAVNVLLEQFNVVLVVNWLVKHYVFSVEDQSGVCSQRQEVDGVHEGDEEQRSKDRSLGYSRCHRAEIRGDAIENHSLISTSEIV